MRKHLQRDTILATAFLFLVLWILSLTVQTGILDPGQLDLPDFDYTDVVFSQSGPNPARFDSNIVIINAGDTDRAGIAAILSKVKTMGPSAIGLDLFFHGYRPTDSLLEAAVAGTPNLVMANDNSMKGEKTHHRFEHVSPHIGFVNFYGRKGNVIRYCLPIHNKDTSFAAAMVRMANPHAFEQLLNRNTDFQAVNYTRRDTEYLIIDHRHLLSDNVDESTLKNKIVLIGFYSANPFNIEDKLLTPKNPVYVGRSLPDMHGVVIHANIISMMLSGNYIYTAPNWMNNLLTIIVGWLCALLFMKSAISKNLWFPIIVKVIQFAAMFVLLLLNLLLFRYGSVKLDISLPIVVLLFSAEILYIYEIISIRMAQRFSNFNIFKSH